MKLYFKQTKSWSALLPMLVLGALDSHAQETDKDIEELPSMVVMGQTVQPGTLNVKPGSTGLNDTADLLTRVPGADISRLGPLSGNAQYRGMSGSRVNVSVDGFVPKDVGPDGMTPPLSNISAHHAQDVTVYRGISPVSSGMETIGGSIKAKSKKGDFATGDSIDFGGNVGSGFNSVSDGWFTNVLTNVANKNHRLEFNGSRERGNSYNFNDDKKVKPTDYNRDIYSLGYGFNTDGHEVAMKYTNINTENTGTPALLMDIKYARGDIMGINYSADLGHDVALDVAFHYQDMQHRMDNFSLRKPLMLHNRGDNVPMVMTHDAITGVESHGGEAVLAFPVLEGTMKTGFNEDQSNHYADMLMEFPTGYSNQEQLYHGINRDRYSPFVEWDGYLTDTLSLNLGGRYTFVNASADQAVIVQKDQDGNVYSDASLQQLQNDFNASDRHVEKNLFDLSSVLRYALNDDLDVEVGFARKNRAPTYQELFLWLPDEANGGLGDARAYIGNQNLKSEVSHQVELGLDWHADKFHLAPRAFYHHVDDFIQGEASDDATINNASLLLMGSREKVLQFGNVDARLYGFDTDWGYVFDDHWHLDGGLSYVRGQRRDNNDNLYRISPLHGNIQLGYHLTNWLFTAETVAYARQGDVSDYNQEVKTAGYTLLNLRGNYKPSYIKGMTLSMGLENVFDKLRYDHLGGLNRVIGNDAISPYSRIPGQGRNFNINFSYDW